MAAIYYERFDVKSTEEPRLVGAHVFHKASFPAMRQHGIFMCGVAAPNDICEIERIHAPFHVMLVVIEGEAELFQGEDHWQVRPGQIGILPIGGQRGFRRVGDQAMVHAWLLLRDHPRWNHLQQDSPWVTETTDSLPIYEAVSFFQREARLQNQGEPEHLAMPALELLSRLLKRALGEEECGDVRAVQLNSWLTEVMHKPAENWNIQQISRYLGWTPAHLHRLCQKYLGQAPGQLVFEVRMKVAREMLKSGGKVAEVASAIGYQEVASFSRRFRQFFGVSPSELQRSGQHQE